MNAQQLAAAASCSISVATSWIDFLNAAMTRYDITTPLRQAGFIGQITEETGDFLQLSENLNYSGSRLAAIFPTHFHNDTEQYAHRPQMIANRVYANRDGNGNEASGDGWKYRGSGLIMLTFRDNYAKYGALAGHDLIANPDLLRMAGQLCADVAASYWQHHGCNELADKSDWVSITKEINGGTNGIADRINNTQHALGVLNG